MRSFEALLTGMALVLLGSGSGVSAGPLDGRFSSAGRVVLGFSPDQGELSLAGDADAHLALGWGVSLNLGLFGVATDLTGDPDTPHETYGTLSWEGAGYRIALGVPRPAYDFAAVSQLDRLDPVRGIAADRIGATRSRVTWGAIHDGGLPLGLRLGGSTADLSWAVSAHQMDSVDVAGFGLTWTQGGDEAWRFDVAGEWASDGHSGGKASVRHQFQDVTLGAAVFLAPAPGVADLVEASLDWRAAEGLELSLMVQAPRDGAAAAVVGAQKTVGAAGFVSGAVRLEGDEASALLSYGLRFGQ